MDAKDSKVQLSYRQIVLFIIIHMLNYLIQNSKYMELSAPKFIYGRRDESDFSD